MAMGLSYERDRCVVFTNREAGEAIGRSATGVLRPPLLAFLEWMQKELGQAVDLDRCTPPPEWKEAWQEWLLQLDNGSASDRLGFLESLEVRAAQDDLPALEKQLVRELAKTFGIPENSAKPLLHALDNALRRWTTNDEVVTAEDVLQVLILENRVQELHRAPPPPAPFFPSRQPVITLLEQTLPAPNERPVFFLSGEPGSGKTSVLSELANRRTTSPLEGVIGVRYFAFQPITPESPMIPADSDYLVKPEALWFGLLDQLRHGLRGRLRSYEVPIRDSFLEWTQARQHVLRLASTLSHEGKQPFIIAIDGIDHAARAARHSPASARAFFESLPSPDEVSAMGIRLLIAGQPPEYYSEYPEWLRSNHALVRRIDLPRLTEQDISTLFLSAAPHFPAEQRHAAVRVIQEITQGNTLAVVFAVAEATRCETADGLQTQLTQRRLQDGLTAYYRNLWQHGLSVSSPAGLGTDVALSCSICLLREDLTSEILATAFQELGLSRLQWSLLLAQLSPLLTQSEDRYRLRHNDFRVFLQSHLEGFGAAQRREFASRLADYYLGTKNNRRAAHETLLTILREAERELDWAKIFTVDWVFESAALGISYEEIAPQCELAIKAGAALKNERTLYEIVCACETLRRWQERSEIAGTDRFVSTSRVSVAPFLGSEVFVRPMNEWHEEDLVNLISDVEELLNLGEHERAATLLQRWLSGLTVRELTRIVIGLADDQGHRHFEFSARQTFERLGAVCRTTGINLSGEGDQSDTEAETTLAFEMGWSRASCAPGAHASLDACFLERYPTHRRSIELAMELLAKHKRWPLVNAALSRLSHNAQKFGTGFRCRAAWWALRSAQGKAEPVWLEILSQRPLDLESSALDDFEPFVALCRARGWNEAAKDPTEIAEETIRLVPWADRIPERLPGYRLLLRTAAVLGRLESFIERRGLEAARDIITPLEVGQLAQAVWSDQRWQLLTEISLLGSLADDFVSLVLPLGRSHEESLLTAAEQPLKSWPADHRRSSLWELLRRTGKRDSLLAWLHRWIGDEGWEWSNDADSRESDVMDWIELARGIGESRFADSALERVRWLRISYSSHKDIAFRTASEWYSELAKLEPESWRDTGVRLWTLTEAAAALRRDNGYDVEIDATIAAAALACGPDDMRRLLIAETPNRSDYSWHHEARNRLINGLVKFIRQRPDLPIETLLIFWSVSVGFCRWFDNNDIEHLAKLRTELLAACTGTKRVELEKAIYKLTPGEAVREARTEHSAYTHSDPDPEQRFDLGFWVNHIENNGTISLATAAALIREIVGRRPPERTISIAKVIRAIASDSSYARDWMLFEASAKPALFEISSLVRDEDWWLLPQAVCRDIGKDTHWLYGVASNLSAVLLSRAVVLGPSELRASMARILEMHERWVAGGKLQREIDEVKLPPSSVTGWSDVGAEVLMLLLSSRYAEVVSSAIQGIHALAACDPGIIPNLFRLVGDDEWKAEWILNTAEVWAAVSADALTEARQEVQRWLTSGPLTLRVQAWLVLTRLGLNTGEAAVPLPRLEGASRPSSPIVQPTREMMEIPLDRVGLMYFTNRKRSADERIRYLEATTGCDLELVRSEVADVLQSLEPSRPDGLKWPESVRRYGDLFIGMTEGRRAVDQVLDELIRKAPVPIELMPRLCQGLLDNEDPWILRATPIPDSNADAWPDSKELGDHGRPVSLGLVRAKLILLANQQGVADEECTLAARIRVFSAKEDFCLSVWWEEQKGDREVRAETAPTTVSGRTFPWWLSDFWERPFENGPRPMTFISGGTQGLMFSFVECVPSLLWLSVFEWYPSPENPLLWLEKGKPVARYERWHGELRSDQSNHFRQPTMERWLVKRDCWQRVQERFGSFRVRQAFEHAEFTRR
jgi:hypothetical protein